MTTVTTGMSVKRTDQLPAVAPRPRPRVRHGILAAGLALVALLRAGQGDWWWTLVFAGGAAAEVAAWFLERRRTTPAVPVSVSGSPTPPDAAVLLTSLEAHRRASRTWTALTVLGLAVAGSLLGAAPAIAAVVALLGVAALALRRRSLRTCTQIERLLDAAEDGEP